MKDIKLLIITTCFSPENAIGSVRLTKIVKYLVRLGYDITVFSPTLHQVTKIDKSLECIELEQIKRIAIPQSAMFSKLFLKRRNHLVSKKSASNYISHKKGKNFWKKIKVEIFRVLHFVYTILRNKDWANQVVKEIKSQYDKESFDVVLSSYPSLGAHWASDKIRNTNIAKYWIADFRDPVNYEKTTNLLLYQIYSFIQNKIAHRADVVTVISNGILNKLEGDKKNKIRLLHNGYDVDDLVNYTQNIKFKDYLKLCYVGSLYGGERKLGVLFNAIRNLIDAGEIKKKYIKIDYAGKEYHVLEKQASEYQLEDLLINHGFITKADAIKLQLESDMVIVATWNTEKDQGILSGKIFESFLTKKCIIGIVNGDKPKSEFAELIREVNGGIVIEEASLTYSKDFLFFQKNIKEKYDEKRSTGFVLANYNSLVKNYSYEYLVGKLNEIIKLKI